MTEKTKINPATIKISNPTTTPSSTLLGVDTVHIKEPEGTSAKVEKTSHESTPVEPQKASTSRDSTQQKSGTDLPQTFPLAKAGANNSAPIKSAIKSLATPASESIFPHKKETATGERILGTYENFCVLFGHYNIEHLYNAVSKLIETRISGQHFSSDNAEEKVLAHLHSLAALHGLPDKHLTKYISAYAYDHAYNPVANWIDSKAWDGIDRISLMCDTIITRKDFPKNLTTIYFRRWSISAIAAIYDQKFRSRGVLTFQGPEAIGKTSWAEKGEQVGRFSAFEESWRGEPWRSPKLTHLSLRKLTPHHLALI